MKHKLHYFLLFLLLISVVFGCNSGRIHTDFSYSPENPKIGDSVFFTNLSAGGEDFSWTFRHYRTGTLAHSTLENPVRVFSLPGEYSVTLRINADDNNIRVRNLYVYDSIPFIARDKETVGIFTNITFRAVAFNPLNRPQTFEWHFSLNAEGENLEICQDRNIKISRVAQPTVWFTRLEQETVKLHMTVDESVFTMEQIPHERFQVVDIPARSLLMARKDGTILRQRIFEKGTGQVEETNIFSGAHPFNIIAVDEQLFIFDAGTNIQENANWRTDTSGDGSIRVVNLVNDNSPMGETVISNVGTSAYFGFYNGFVDNEYIYWTDRNDFFYKIPKTTRNQVFEWRDAAQNTLSYYVASAQSLGLAQGQLNGGIYFRDGIYYWAKANDGKGIHRFRKENGQIVRLSTRLGDFSIRSFVFDWQVELIYFIATESPDGKAGVWVAHIDGTQAQLIDALSVDNPLEYITGILIDREAGRLLWAHKSGVKQIRLLQNARERPQTPTPFNQEEGILGITLDNNLRFAQ